MDTYKSDKQVIDCDIATVYGKLSNPAVFKQQLEQNIDKLPEEARAQLQNLKFEDDYLFRLGKRRPGRSRWYRGKGGTHQNRVWRCAIAGAIRLDSGAERNGCRPHRKHGYSAIGIADDAQNDGGQ